MTRKEKAIELHDKGFNCAQAVACAFAEETGIPEEILFAACEGFGLGMGGMAGNAFYEIDLECVKKKKQCVQTVHPEKKTDRINSRNMKDKDNIR